MCIRDRLKTAVLLAGLGAEGETRVNEPALSRNHTELMLPEFGVDATSAYRSAMVQGPATLKASEIDVPGDPSSAAFLLSLIHICSWNRANSIALIPICSSSTNPQR